MILIVTLVIFVVYLFSLHPALPAYRDAGEFVVDSLTLGVVHPPGYPFYVLLNRLIGLIIPWGNYAWRLNISSALVGTFSLLLFYGIISRLGKEIFKEKSGRWLYLLLFFVAFSHLFWQLTIVPEPYILNVFFVLAVIYFLLGNIREQVLACFIFGLGLSNRLDMILVFPLLFLVVWQQARRLYFSGLLLLILGASLYLYLPLRARTGPWFNWNNPASFTGLISTLTRRSYGHSLDLIASGYAAGENFWPGILFYLREMFMTVGYLGILPLFAGLFGLAKYRPKIFWSLGICFFLTGPVFIYLANMPPNPHSFKILQDSFLLPGMFLFLFLGVGVILLGRKYFSLTILLLVFLSGINFYQGIKKNFHRFNFSVFDYTKNIFRSCPPGSILVQKKDIQLFSTWWSQIVEKNRLDVVSIAQGLSGSPWYQQMLKQRYPDVFLLRLQSVDSIENLINQNPRRSVVLAVDTELALPPGPDFGWQGLVYCKTPKENFLFENFYIWRKHPADFFSQNIFTDYGRAFHNLGVQQLSRKEYSLARRNFILACDYDDTLAISLSFRAYSYLGENNFTAAQQSYQQCIQSYQRLLQLAKKYKAFPEVLESFKKDLAGAYANLGVVQERLGNIPEAKKAYQTGLAVSPSAQLYFNLAALYWKENDFFRAEEYLRSALQLDPNYPQARFYHQLIREKIRQQ